MRAIITAMLIATLSFAALSCGSSESRQGPNVLIISVDTLRLDRLSCYGGEPGTSPRVDQLAAEGVRFASVQAVRGLTWPSLTTLHTGLHPRTHQVRANGAQLDEAIITLPQMFADAGYDTGGFLSNMCDAPNRGLGTFFCSWWEKSGPPTGKVRRQWASHEQPQWDAAITREALAFMTEERDRPFYAWVHYIDPHKPFDVVPEYIRDEYDGSFSADDESLAELTLTGTTMSEHQRRQLMAIYDSQVTATDAHIGTLLDALEEAGLADNTLVVFTADHGEELGDHNAYFYHLSSVYQQVLAIPFILRWPAGLEGGRTIDATIAAVDLAPTILSLTGLPQAPEMEGSSRAALATGQGDGQGAAVTFAEWEDKMLVVGQDDWRYVWNPNGIITFGAPFERNTGRGFTIEKEELYDLATDPLQENNVVSANREQADEMRHLACDFLRQGDFHHFAPRPISPEARERLESLGYLQGEDEMDDGIPPLADHCADGP
jgi:arylsulfatase A-like enzyme